MTTSRTMCPDCESSLQPIKLIDATEPGRQRQGSLHVELSYAVPEARASYFTGTIEKAGTVKANLCPACGRIVLFAQAVDR